MNRRIFAVLLLALFTGCYTTLRVPVEVQRKLGRGIDGGLNLLPPQSRKAKDLTSIEGINIELSAKLWRTFLPVEPSRTVSYLSAVLELRTDNGSMLPSGIVVDRIWVVKDSQVWQPEILDKHPVGRCTAIYYKSHAGPEWPPSAKVDVLISLQDTTGHMQYLQVRQQRIERRDIITTQ
jgi:hypothetical protein